MKKTIFFVTLLAVLLLGSTAVFAAENYKTPAEILSGLTGKGLDAVTAARQNGQSYGQQAADVGKLEEFKAERLEQYKSALDEAVKSGSITQEKADELYAAMESRMALCTGTGTGSGCAGLNQGGVSRGNGGGYGMGRLGGGCGNFTSK